MKKLIYFTLCLMIQSILTSQTWKTDIQRTTGKPLTRTLKLKPKNDLRIGTLLNDADSIKESKFYYGKFLSGSKDSLTLKIISIENLHTESAGLKQSEVIQAKYFTRYKADSVYNLSVALTDVHFISYQQDCQKFFGGGEDFLLLGSLAVLVVSPLICYNYKEGAFNAESYKYWALGSTAGILLGMSFQMMGGHTKLQFISGWPSEKAKKWIFIK